MIRLLAILLLLSAAGWRAHSEVFLLAPWQNRGQKAGDGLFETLPGIGERPLYREAVTVNGVSLDLTVYRCDAAREELLRYLALHFPKENLLISGETIRAVAKLANGQIERWLLIGAGLGKPVTVFRMTTPEKLPLNPAWPRELPALPPGAKPLQVIRLSRSGGVYGFFSRAGANPEELLRQTSHQLETAGWIPIGRESSPSINGRGDLFVSTARRRIAWATYGPEGSGSFFSKPY